MLSDGGTASAAPPRITQEVLDTRDALVIIRHTGAGCRPDLLRRLTSEYVVVSQAAPVDLEVSVAAGGGQPELYVHRPKALVTGSPDFEIQFVKSMRKYTMSQWEYERLAGAGDGALGEVVRAFFAPRYGGSKPDARPPQLGGADLASFFGAPLAETTQLVCYTSSSCLNCLVAEAMMTDLCPPKPEDVTRTAAQIQVAVLNTTLNDFPPGLPCLRETPRLVFRRPGEGEWQVEPADTPLPQTLHRLLNARRPNVIQTGEVPLADGGGVAELAGLATTVVFQAFDSYAEYVREILVGGGGGSAPAAAELEAAFVAQLKLLQFPSDGVGPMTARLQRLALSLQECVRELLHGDL